MADKYRKVVDIAASSGVESLAVCVAAYKHKVPIWFDSTGKCAPVEPDSWSMGDLRDLDPPESPVSQWMRDHDAMIRKAGLTRQDMGRVEPEPVGMVKITQRTVPRQSPESAGFGYKPDCSADAIDIAEEGEAVVYLRQWAVQDSIREAAIKAIIANGGISDDGDPRPGHTSPMDQMRAAMRATDWWTALGSDDPDAFVVDVRRNARSNQSRTAKVRIADLYIGDRGVALLGQREGWTVDAAPPGTELPEGVTWAAIAAMLGTKQPRHPRQSPHLVAAVQAWAKLQHGESKRRPGVKDKILSEIEVLLPNATATTHLRIARVCNPHKDPGARRT